MLRDAVPRLMAMLCLCGAGLVTSAPAEKVPPFDASSLVKLGDTTRYGSYTIEKIGEGIYKLNDRSPEKRVNADSSGCRCELTGRISALAAAWRTSASAGSCAEMATVS
jgi:hypothetical protein